VSLTNYRITRDGAQRLLFLLHGWSAEQHHLAAYVPLVDPDERFSAICPRALYDLPDGDGASWYDRTDDGPVSESFLATVDTLASFIDAEASAVGVPLDGCVVGGFSQGGFLALALAGREGAPRYAGVWAMCCAMPEVAGLDLEFGAGAGSPALIQVGERDQIITPDRGRAAAWALAAAGWDVTERGYDMAHSQRIEMMVDARDWLAAM
jgi:predicted esterase